MWTSNASRRMHPHQQGPLFEGEHDALIDRIAQQEDKQRERKCARMIPRQTGSTLRTGMLEEENSTTRSEMALLPCRPRGLLERSAMALASVLDASAGA